MKILVIIGFLTGCAITGAIIGTRLGNRTTGVALGIRGES